MKRAKIAMIIFDETNPNKTNFDKPLFCDIDGHTNFEILVKMTMQALSLCAYAEDMKNDAKFDDFKQQLISHLTNN
jgi:hypothetical protein